MQISGRYNYRSYTNLRYSIVGGNAEGRFKVDPGTGLISVEKVDGATSSRHYTIEVSVTDGEYSDKAAVHIQVEKSDNSGLAFSKERYVARVLENTTKTDVVVVVDALGAALNENLEFSILSPTDMFVIGTTSGAVRYTNMNIT